PIRFRPSPFYRVERALSSVATLIKAGPGDRKVATVRFKLTEPQLELLRKSKEAKSNVQYQVRLYCTSDTNYNQIRPQAHQFPAPIEFPAACEVKLNNVLVPANTKGIKKQPGTAPPVNLSGTKGPAVSTTSSDVTHTVDLIYTNTEKVYYIVAYLIEYTPIDKIVGRVKTGKTRSKEEVIQGIIKLNDDPDVEASAFGLSLKDPLSYARIETPIRSLHCQHIACFDAVTWFEINEQTPQWMCPICNKPLKVEDMVVDGYLEDILKICSSSVDSVTVEPDGTWRSDNDKFGTAKPRIAASSSTSVRNSPTPSATNGGDKKPFSGSGSGSGTGGGRGAVTLELDSDSGDD
ncbi:zf-MIZ-domain-containing protein, partial [Rhodotorula sp. JG-1b]